MGTNFYWDPPDIVPDDMDPEYHIGKRSAAGHYCYDCNLSMCAAGEGSVHQGGPRSAGSFLSETYKRWEDAAWHKECPKCGLSAGKEDLKDSAAGVELGFGESKRKRPSGIHSCCSFSFCQDPDAVEKRCLESGDDIGVFDEYNRAITGNEFLTMLEAQCPIQFKSSIGQWFC